jgi:negative regulator of sigma E activity
MKTEDQAWRDLRAHASAQLHTGFADRALRAARAAAEMPSLSSQFALSAATAVVCLAAVVFVQDRTAQQADERNLADWERIVLTAQDTQDVDTI